MSYIIFALKGILLLISLCGYALWLIRKFKIKQEFVPITIFAAISLIMFIAGILNIMVAMVYIILIGGIFLCVMLIYHEPKIMKYINPGVVVFIVLTIAIGIVSINYKIAEWDNFSHWALIVKNMIAHDRLPNFSDAIITFQSYPTASSGLLYFTCKVLGYHEAAIYFIHNVMILSGFLTIVSIIKNKHYIYYAFSSIAIVFLLVYNSKVGGVMVDTLLVSLGVSLVVILYYYKDCLEKSIILVLPIACILPTVKNSGLFFVISGVICAGLFWNKSKNRKDLLYKCSIIVLPLFFLYLWKRHVSLVFVQADSSIHSMSLSYFKTIFGEKTSSDITQIMTKYIEESVIGNGVYFIIIISLMLLLYFKIKSDKVQFKQLLIACKYGGIIYLLYHVSLICTYLFSMPLNEAVKLASYERYHKSILQYLMAMLLIYSILQLRNRRVSEGKYKYVWMSVMLLLFIPITLSVQSYSGTHNQYLEKRMLVENTIGAENINSDDICLISSEENDVGYYTYLIRYLLMNTNITVLSESELKSYEAWETVDYYICLDAKVDMDFVKKNMPKTGVVLSEFQ